MSELSEDDIRKAMMEMANTTNAFDGEFILWACCIHCHTPQTFGGKYGIHCTICGNYGLGSNEELMESFLKMNKKQ